MNDLCNVIWWIIYERQHSGNHQQVTGESTVALKRITDNSHWFDRQTAKKDWRQTMKSTSLSLSPCLSHTQTHMHLFRTSSNSYCSNGPLLLNWALVVPFTLMRINLLSVSLSLQVDCVYGWFCGWWCWSQAGWEHAPGCVCVTLRPWRSAASPRTSP